MMVFICAVMTLAFFITLGLAAFGNEALAQTPAPPTITSGPTVSNIKPGTATFSWTTSTLTTTGVLISATSGGPYNISATVLSPKTLTHTITPSSVLSSGTTYYYYVRSCDAVSQCVQSSEGSFTTTTWPDLTLTADNIYWPDMAAYNARMLSIDYSVINVAGDDASNVVVAGTMNSNAVTSQNTPFPIGNIPAGGVGNMTIEYHVPQGIGSFSNTVYATAEDPGGVTYYYPGPYPGP
jgi:hypothetical protein